MGIHDPLLSNASVNAFVHLAVDQAAEAAQRNDGADVDDLTAALQAAYAAIPDALKPNAIESLRQHAAHAAPAAERTAALRALEWLVTA